MKWLNVGSDPPPGAKEIDSEKLAQHLRSGKMVLDSMQQLKEFGIDDIAENSYIKLDSKY